MEEIITIDGRQFKLTTDRPLTASERVQAIADIRKQSGCGCGAKSLGTQISSLAPCTATGKTGGDTVTLTVQALSGVAPYTTHFFKDLGAGRVNIDTSVVGMTGTIATDGGTDSGVYTILDSDAKNANYGGVAQIQFVGTITDSCPSPGPLTCEGSCEVSITCVTPTCSFTVV